MSTTAPFGPQSTGLLGLRAPEYRHLLLMISVPSLYEVSVSYGHQDIAHLTPWTGHMIAHSAEHTRSTPACKRWTIPPGRGHALPVSLPYRQSTNKRSTASGPTGWPRFNPLQVGYELTSGMSIAQGAHCFNPL